MDSAGIPWYSTGTVNVTQGSSNVAGVGTNWVNAGLKVGDIFTIDKSRLYQITAINSNTSLSLQEAYQGATGTAQVYFVIRNFAGTMQAQIAAQVSKLVNKYESYIDTELKQITGPAGPTSFPYRGTWATGRSYNGLDVVQYGNQLYMALYGHTSSSANAPGATGTAWTNLSISINGAVQNGGGDFSWGPFSRNAYISTLVQSGVITGIRIYGQYEPQENGDNMQIISFLNGRILHQTYDFNNKVFLEIGRYNAESDTGWQTFDNYFRYRKKNGIVFIKVTSNSIPFTSSNSYESQSALPSDCCPSEECICPIIANGKNTGGLRIRVNGTIQIFFYTDVTGMYVNTLCSYPV